MCSCSEGVVFSYFRFLERYETSVIFIYLEKYPFWPGVACLCFVWMIALGGLALYWIECQCPMILILISNANIFVWMFRHSEPRVDIEVKCQILFGWSNRGIALV
jgi:hypothetical protein